MRLNLNPIFVAHLDEAELGQGHSGTGGGASGDTGCTVPCSLDEDREIQNLNSRSTQQRRARAASWTLG